MMLPRPRVAVAALARSAETGVAVPQDGDVFVLENLTCRFLHEDVVVRAPHAGTGVRSVAAAMAAIDEDRIRR